jgi:hypothetical protein
MDIHIYRARLSSHKEVLLVFDGDLDTCDRSAISSKLRHLKRLLGKRFEARQQQGSTRMYICTYTLSEFILFA